MCYFIYHCIQQADGDAEIKDGSFTEILASGTEKQSLNGTGKTSDIKLIYPFNSLSNRVLL